MEDGADAVPGRLIRCRRADQRNENTALAQRFPRALLDLAAKRVKDNIDIGSDVLEAILFVVNGLIDAELTQELLIFRRCRAEDVCPLPVCELHGEGAHAAGRTVNQDPLPPASCAVSNRARQAVSPATPMVDA